MKHSVEKCSKRIKNPTAIHQSEREHHPYLHLTRSRSPSSGSCESTSLNNLSLHKSKKYKKRRIQCDYYKEPAIKGKLKHYTNGSKSEARRKIEHEKTKTSLVRKKRVPPE